MKIKLFVLLSTLAVSLNSIANDYNYPGGIAQILIDKQSEDLPTVRYGLKEPVLIDEGSQWKILIGIDLQQLPGQYHVYIRPSGEDDTSRFENFDVIHKAYPLTSSQPIDVTASSKHHSLTDLDFSNSQPPTMPMGLPFSSEWDPGFGQLSFNNESNQTTPQNSTFSDAEPLTLVKAPLAGIVSRIVDTANGWSTVTIDHGRGLYSVIHQIDELAIELGSGVTTGAVIGKVPEPNTNGPSPKTPAARSLNSRSSRVYWQVQMNGVFVNPLILTQL